MTPEQIDTIRNQRACNVPWTVISRHIGYSVASEPQRDLFSGQPDRAEVSDK